MPVLFWILKFVYVALRKESVDRNLHSRNGHNVNRVALRKESVDRNMIHPRSCNAKPSRSPQGERG